MPAIVVVGGGIVGTAIAHALQGSCQVILVDDSDFPGLAQTRLALGVIRAWYDREPLATYSARTWEFALAQHENPRSPLRLRFAALDHRPARAAFLDHLLLLDAFLLRARRAGCRLRVGAEITELVLQGGRVRGVRLARHGQRQGQPQGQPRAGDIIEADAVVLAPGPRPDTLSLEGLPEGFHQRFTPVKDTIIPFRLPAAPAAEGPTTGDASHAAVITRRSLIWTFITGLQPGTLFAVARTAGDWSPPSFEDTVAMVEDLYRRFHLPGEAELDRIRTCIDLAGPGGVPFAGPVAPLGGAAGLFVAAGMGLEGLSLCAGVAEEIARSVRAYLA